MRIYNTQKRELDALAPPEAEGVVGMYVCGPTVYDAPHIGHLRSAFVFDVVRKALRHAGYRVKLVRNVTDVDDKIIDRAPDEKMPAKQLAAKYLGAYHEALDAFGIERPDAEPKATEHIREMQVMIRGLIEGGFAYSKAGSVYFRVRKFKDYGALSNRRNLDELFQNTRKEPDEVKEDPFDFALWKKTDDELSVDSPWGRGRPGWHIECSAMSSAHLGDAFAIHGGGLDLLFPHHENERAQSMADGKPFARIWMHHGLVTVDGKKMSKSLGNFITLDEVRKRGHSFDALKLLFLQSHYRSDVDFNWNKLKTLDDTLKSFRLLFEKTAGVHAEDANLEGLEKLWVEALGNDFDTPRLLSILFEALRLGNWHLAEEKTGSAAGCADWIRKRGSILGLFSGPAECPSRIWIPMLEKVARLRSESRKAKRYEVSDLIRFELVKIGFEAEDQKGGTSLVYIGKASDADVEIRLKDLLKRAESMS